MQNHKPTMRIFATNHKFAWLASLAVVGWASLAAAVDVGKPNDAKEGDRVIAAGILTTGNTNSLIAGSTSATDYPVTPGALQAKNAGAGGKFPYDGVASVFSNDLDTLHYSTYLE